MEGKFATIAAADKIGTITRCFAEAVAASMELPDPALSKAYEVDEAILELEVGKEKHGSLKRRFDQIGDLREEEAMPENEGFKEEIQSDIKIRWRSSNRNGR